MKTNQALRSVAVFDANWPPSVAFVRSLGRAGIPVTVYHSRRFPVSRFSRYTSAFRTCPDTTSADEFSEWLSTRIERGEVDLVAPTSDNIVFCVAEAHERIGHVEPGMPSPATVRDCLFKDFFAKRMDEAGFPTVPSVALTSLDDAVPAAESLGYPLVLKPRSHVGRGRFRGCVVHSREALVEQLEQTGRYDSDKCAAYHNEHIHLPVLQQFLDHGEIDVISVTGCLDADGTVHGLSHCRKLRAWPPRLGTGTRFEAISEQPFTARAVETVRTVLGRGLFELEVLVHRPSGRAWTIDLNPRGYGQMSLAIARGNDLPKFWYEAVTGSSLPAAPLRRVQPQYWQSGIQFYTGATIAMATGPERRQRAREFVTSVTDASVGAFFDWRDPVPVVASVAFMLRHPGGLVRPYLQRGDSDHGQ